MGIVDCDQVSNDMKQELIKFIHPKILFHKDISDEADKNRMQQKSGALQGDWVSNLSNKSQDISIICFL